MTEGPNEQGSPPPGEDPTGGGSSAAGPPPGSGPPPPGNGPPPGYGPPPAPRPGIIPLAPLAMDQLLSGAVRYVRANKAAVLIPALIVSLIVAALQFTVQTTVFTQIISGADVPVVPVVVLGIVAVVLLFLVYPPLLATQLSTLVPAVTGRRMSLGEAWTAGRPHLGRLYGVYAVLTLIGLVIFGVGYGFFLLIVLTAQRPGAGTFLLAFLVLLVVYVVGVYVSVLLHFSIPATIVEGAGAGDALRRSRELVRGSWWRLFGIELVAGLVAGVAAFVVLIPFVVIGIVVLFSAGSGPGEATGFVAYFAILAVGLVVAATPLSGFSIGLAGLLYVDQRIRRERFDLQLLGHANDG